MQRYFKPQEFRCRCDRGEKCDATQMDIETVMKLEGLRRELGEAMVITSADRCPYWNDKVGGSSTSYHLRGRAVDVQVKNGQHAGRILLLAVKHGFTGIGVSAGGFLHLDTREFPLTVFGY